MYMVDFYHHLTLVGRLKLEYAQDCINYIGQDTGHCPWDNVFMRDCTGWIRTCAMAILRRRFML